MFEAAVATRPVSLEPYAAFARRHLETGQAGPALAVTSQGLARFPADTALLAAQAVAAAAAGDTGISAILLDFDRLLSRIDVAAPTGWKSVAAFNAALADHPLESAHPFLARIPDRFGLNIWSINLQQAGHQVPHIHSAAWLSRVYYPQLPPVIGEDYQAGWIEFGQPPEQIACGRDPDVLLIRPKEGLMLLFPSYMYHRTIPFSGDGTRISIAFDVSLVS